MITIGCCPVSNDLQYSNPLNGIFVFSIDYKFQDHVTSGACFGLCYLLGTLICRLDESCSNFTLKITLESQVYVHTNSPPHQATIIGIPSYDCPDIYHPIFSWDFG